MSESPGVVREVRRRREGDEEAERAGPHAEVPERSALHGSTTYAIEAAVAACTAIIAPPISRMKAPQRFSPLSRPC